MQTNDINITTTIMIYPLPPRLDDESSSVGNQSTCIISGPLSLDPVTTLANIFGHMTFLP